MDERKITIAKVFTFDCAHSLNDYNGKCKNIHGHTYKLEVNVRGNMGEDGIVIDFHELNDIVEKEILCYIDHRYLNELFDFNPTCEHLGLWIWDRIAGVMPASGCELKKIVLWETPTSFITIGE